MTRLFIFLVINLFFCAHSFAQINHYWSNQVGAKSTMLGGAVVGNVNDNSAIFYNPGFMSFIEKSSISAEGDAIYLDYIKHKNGAGSNLSPSSISVEFIPSAFLGTFKHKTKKWLTINYGTINRNTTRNTFYASNSGEADILASNAGLESFNSYYRLTNENREDWFVLGRGIRLNERIGIGVSLIVSFLTQTQTERVSVSVSEFGINGLVNELAFNRMDTDFSYSNVGLLAKFGFAYTFDKIKLGMTITLPRASIPMISLGYLNRSRQTYIPGVIDDIAKLSFNRDRIRTQYRSPLIIDVGLSYSLNEKNELYTTVAYFSKVNSYNQLDVGKNFNYSLISGYSTIYRAHKEIVNIALGYQYKVNDSYSVLAGVRTDFSYFNDKDYTETSGFVPVISDYNLYHISLGVNYVSDRLSLNLGIVSAVGQSDKMTSVINLNDPKDSNFLIGSSMNNVKTNFFRIGALLGVTLYLNSKN